jgi:MFS family permease
MPFRAAWHDLREAIRLFSPPARRFLLAISLAWGGHGVAQVLFNLYLVEAGFREAFVGQAISLNGLGLAFMALPAGILADRWGRRPCLILGAVLDGLGLWVRAAAPTPEVIAAASFVAGAGQSLLAIAALPFLTEHSTPRERTYLFSSFIAVELAAGVIGSFVGGWIPNALRALPAGLAPDLMHAYRYALIFGATLGLSAAIPLLGLPKGHGAGGRPEPPPPLRAGMRDLSLMAVMFFMIGFGAGLVIPFMNLYFATRFQCSSAQIGAFFAVAQSLTAAAAMVAPLLARWFGALKTATIMQLLSLPFLVTLGFERHLNVAVAAFCIRATLMQAASPLLQTFVMEVLPARLRARAASVTNLVWNIGWATSATVSGWIIQEFGYATPFYITAGLYGSASLYFYSVFRKRRPAEETKRPEPEALMPEEAKGLRGEGPFTE